MLSTRATPKLTLNPKGHYDYDLKYKGTAAALLRVIHDSAPVTFLLTKRCDITCAHCYYPKPTPAQDLDSEIIKATADELNGLEKVYFSGGEPFRYLAGDKEHEKIFMDLVHYVAGRAGKLLIDTNGSFLPADIISATSFLRQFPRNTVFILSVDSFHAEALARREKSLEAIQHTLEEACSAASLLLEINTRYTGRKKDPGKTITHANHILAQGEALKLPKSETVPLNLVDFIEHLFMLKGIGLFVRTDGYVVNGDHAAFSEPPPPFALLGNLHQQSLARIIWERLIPGIHDDFTYSGAIESRGVEKYFAPVDTSKIIERAKTPKDTKDWPPAIATYLTSGLPRIRWMIDQRQIKGRMVEKSGAGACCRESIQRFIAGLGEKEIDKITSEPAGRLVDFFLDAADKQGEVKLSSNFKLFSENGKISLEMALDSAPADRKQSTYIDNIKNTLNNFCDLSTGSYLHISFFNAMLTRLIERFRRLDEQVQKHFGLFQFFLSEIVEHLEGARANEIISILRDKNMPGEWVISRWNRNNRHLRGSHLTTLDKMILKDFGDDIPPILGRMGAEFVNRVLNLDNPQELALIRYQFIIIKGELHINEIPILSTGPSSNNPARHILLCLNDFISGTFRYFDSEWDEFRMVYFEPIIGYPEAGLSPSGKLLLKAIKAFANININYRFLH